MPGPVGQLFLADLDQLIHRPAGEPEPRLGLDGALPLVLVGAFRRLLRGPRLALLATDERRAHHGRDGQEDQDHHARGEDERMSPPPAPRALERASAVGPGSAAARGTAPGRRRSSWAVAKRSPASLRRAFRTIVSSSAGIVGSSDRGAAGIVGGDLPVQLVAVPAVEGRAQGQQLVQRRAERIDVAPVVDDAPPGLELLRTGVAQGAQELSGHRQPGVAGDLGQAEVGDPELAPKVEQEVARLDVPMHDPGLVGVLDRQGRLPAKIGHAVEMISRAHRATSSRWDSRPGRSVESGRPRGSRSAFRRHSSAINPARL